jgi:hypothetical protein
MDRHAGEQSSALAWKFVPAPAVPPVLFRQVTDASTGFTRFTGAAPPPGYRLNPPPECSGGPAKGRCTQALLASPEGRGWVTAWAAAGAGRLLVAVTSDIPVRVGVAPKRIRASAEATAVLASAMQANSPRNHSSSKSASLAAEHTRWWAEFWWSDVSGSFLSLPSAGAKLEQFHYIQAMKIGSENACRRFKDSAFEAGVLDNCMLVDGASSSPCSLSLPCSLLLPARPDGHDQGSTSWACFKRPSTHMRSGT